MSIAFVGALAVTVLAQRANDENARDTLVTNRIEELVLTLSALAPENQAEFAADASNRVTTIKIAADPAVLNTSADDRSILLAARIAQDLGQNDVRVSILSRAEPSLPEDSRNFGLNREVVLVSLQLDNNRWLNFSAREPLSWHTNGQLGYLLSIYACSLIIVLGAVWIFLRQTISPIQELAIAAQRSAKGDRSARVREAGPFEFQQAAKAFNTMQERISQFDAERTRTIAAVGHDLRTPLTSLRIRAEMIEGELREPMIETLDEVAAMADGLVSYARTGQSENLTQSVSLKELLAKLCEELDVPFHATGDPVITAGPVSFSRAIRNLVENALAYAGQAEVVLSVQGGKAIIKVEDDGPGIELGLLSTIFDPFVRGEASRSRVTGGAGLGLSIARDIIVAHGGELDVVNKPERGVSALVMVPSLSTRR
ncbi:ATP-binding protein [Octadecabacter sp. CECT 8868]|uniref:ATP-binding protein n=1 Tax=Octadecabacter algicola TaxID=2909342 RepID=UPI001F248857|nr:ATP-binding protein [Octadecabacter algicola]MCF2904255.1 ATP-binding protein [Octadecabacter algicola]